MPQKEILCLGAGGKTLSPASRFECHQNHLMKLHTEQVEEATVNCGAIKPSRDLMKEPIRRTPPPPNGIGTPEFNKWLTLLKHCVGSQGLDQ